MNLSPVIPVLVLALAAPVLLAEDNDADDTNGSDNEAPDLAELVETKALFGHVERVQLEPGSIQVDARVDTGAARSSLSAVDIETFDHNGDSWVRFRFRTGDDDNDNGGSYGFELPVVEEITIIQASGDETRYVVRLGLCIGEQFAETDFTLTDRTDLTYPVLVGRSFLADIGLVSSRREYTMEPNCTTNDED